jgi:hypothetical protein
MALKPLEGLSGELDLFAPPLVETGILSGEYVEYKTIQNIGDENAPLEFFIPGQGDRYIALDRTLLRVQFKVTDENGKAYPNAATDKKISLANYTLHSLFSDIRVTLNNNQVGSSSHMYGYRAYLEALMSFNDSSKKSHLTSALWSQDTPGSMAAETSAPFLERAGFVEKGKVCEVMGRIHTDITSQPRLMLNEVDVGFRLTRADSKFVCLADKTLKPQIKITDVSLYVRKCVINPSVLLAHSKMLQSHTAKYPIRRVELYNYSLPKGTVRSTLEHIFPGKLPSRIILGFVKSSAFNGTVEENPYNFEHNNVNMISVSIDGVVLGGKPLAPDFTSDKAMQSFTQFYMHGGIPLTDDGFSISRQDYLAGGMVLFAFDTTPLMTASEDFWTMPNEGSCRIELGFSTGLTDVTTAVIYAEFRDVLQCNRGREFAVI